MAHATGFAARVSVAANGVKTRPECRVGGRDGVCIWVLVEKHGACEGSLLRRRWCELRNRAPCRARLRAMLGRGVRWWSWAITERGSPVSSSLSRRIPFLTSRPLCCRPHASRLTSTPIASRSQSSIRLQGFFRLFSFLPRLGSVLWFLFWATGDINSETIWHQVSVESKRLTFM